MPPSNEAGQLLEINTRAAVSRCETATRAILRRFGEITPKLAGDNSPFSKSDATSGRCAGRGFFLTVGVDVKRAGPSLNNFTVDDHFLDPFKAWKLKHRIQQD